MRTLIKHVLASKEPSDSLEVAGWVRTRRDSKAFSFIELNDGSCLGNIQIVADAGIPGYEDIGENDHRSLRFRFRKAHPVPCEGAGLGNAGRPPSSCSAPLLMIFRSRKRGTRPSFSAASPTSARARISTAPPSASARAWPTRSTVFSKSAISSTSTRPSSPPAIARARGKCSG